MRIAVDVAQTAKRLTKLRKYMDEHVYRPGAGMCCQHFAECQGSVPSGYRFDYGQLSHVGRHYDLSADGLALRIVVVGQEPGLWSLDGAPREGVSLEERYRRIHDHSGRKARYYKTGGHPGRNPHMRGTTSALRILFGRGLGTDYEGEFLMSTEGERFHIFDGFALVNVLICSAGQPDSSRGQSSRTMRKNCLKHFETTIEFLEPTIVILQGRGVREWLKPSIAAESRTATDAVSRATLAGIDVVLCSFTHPSAHAPHGWGNRIDGEYLCNTVKPGLETALKLL